MRVLIATDAWRPHVCGVVRTLTALAKSAPAIGLEVEFLSPEGFPSFSVPTYPGLRLAVPDRREIARRIAGDARPFTVRPEKIALAEPAAPVPAGACSAEGHVAEVVYLGAVTRYIVELDGGGSLVVMQQNLTTSSMEALQVRGKSVRLVWDPSNNRSVEASAG